MMLKRKRTDTNTQSHLPNLAVVPENQQPDVFLDNLTRVVGNFGFQQILLSPFEDAKFFAKHPDISRHFGEEILELSAGTSDLVWSPTYLFSVLKRYISNFKQRGPHVSKWFHLSPIVRQRATGPGSVHEFGLYVMGEDSAMAGAQLINTVAEILRELGVPEFIIELNSLGCRSCQRNYKDSFENHMGKGFEQLCQQCQEKFERRPTSMWDCHNGSCREIFAGAPQIVDSLDDLCKANLMGVLEQIDALSIPYTLNPILNGPLLEEKVVFRITAPQAKEGIIGHGGNYSFWATTIGNTQESLPVMGFRTTFEQLWEAVPEDIKRTGPKVEVFMVPLGAIASRRALVLHRDLQHSGISAQESMLGNASIKNQLKEAVNKRCEIALIIGQKEALDETVILRDMRSGMQEVFAQDRIIEEVKKRLGK